MSVCTCMCIYDYNIFIGILKIDLGKHWVEYEGEAFSENLSIPWVQGSL